MSEIIPADGAVVRPAASHRAVRRFDFPELVARPSGPSLLGLADLSRVPLDVQVSLGSIELNVDELLTLQAGSVLPLQGRAGESVVIVAGDVPIARGEVRIHKNRFAIRIREVFVTEHRGDV